MKILVTGASGYIGKKLIAQLIEKGHFIYALCRNPKTALPKHPHITILQGDLLQPATIEFPKEIDAAYYLVHSMTDSKQTFESLEEQCCLTFLSKLKNTQAKQVIYLTGLIPKDESLSPHLRSRHRVENLLQRSSIPATTLRAGIIVGAGSASFEMIRDLVEKLPIMVAPKWIHNRTQPIGIRDALFYLTSVLGDSRCFNQSYDIGSEDCLTFKELMLQFSEVRHLTRYILSVPVLTPKLSSYWIYFISRVPYSLASSLVESLKTPSICQDHRIRSLFPRKLKSYKQAVKASFDVLESGALDSSWMDEWGSLPYAWNHLEHVPKQGCYRDRRKLPLHGDPSKCFEKVLCIGGNNGWYYLNKLWVIRGFLDRLIGGVGLRRGRRSATDLKPGDALDFWRVILVDKNEHHLLLYAEMKLPGEAWLEWHIHDGYLIQTATFRPKGLLGRAYWFALVPIHCILFQGLAKKIVKHEI